MSVWRQEALSQSQNCCSYQQSTPAMLPKPYLKVMVPLVVQRLEDTAPQVRDAACEVLGTLLELLGDRPMVAYIVMPCRWPKKVFSSKIIFSFTRSHAEFRVKAQHNASCPKHAPALSWCQLLALLAEKYQITPMQWYPAVCLWTNTSAQLGWQQSWQWYDQCFVANIVT